MSLGRNDLAQVVAVGVDGPDAAGEEGCPVDRAGVAADEEEGGFPVGREPNGADLVATEVQELASAAAVGDAKLHRFGGEDDGAVFADVDKGAASAVGPVGVDFGLTGAVGVDDEDTVWLLGIAGAKGVGEDDGGAVGTDLGAGDAGEVRRQDS